jgi:hypothetical protein
VSEGPRRFVVFDYEKATSAILVVDRAIAKNKDQLHREVVAGLGLKRYIIGPFKWETTQEDINRAYREFVEVPGGLRFGQALMNKFGTSPCPDLFYERSAEKALQIAESYL